MNSISKAKMLPQHVITYSKDYQNHNPSFQHCVNTESQELIKKDTVLKSTKTKFMSSLFIH